MALPELREFLYQQTFRMSFDNILIFTGLFTNASCENLIGKNLHIPLSNKHAAFSLKLSSQTLFGVQEKQSLIVKFNSEEEREIIAKSDFTGDIFL